LLSLRLHLRKVRSASHGLMARPCTNCAGIHLLEEEIIPS